MASMISCIKLAFASTLLAAATASGATINIDFESMPGADGALGTADDVPMADNYLVWIRDQLTPAGITFSQGSMIQASFFDGNPRNHFLSSTSPIGSFSIPVFGISIESKSYWNATLTAYGASGNVLATSTIAPSSDAAALLSVTTTEAIASFSVLPDNPSSILNLDNMVLTVSAVPEPATWGMFGAGLALLGWHRRRALRG
ncbi:MAG TPA: PEP-CTERM sorting domain-containing protein [Duganella sp.]|jgi:hypothetical protein